MKKTKCGDKIKIHYTGKTEDGSVFGSSKGRNPIEFEIGAGNFISGLENGVIGMAVGDKKSITVPPKDAFGHVREELLSTIRKNDFPETIQPTIGQRLQVKQPDGKVANVTVVDVQEESVTLDANHALAGQTLKFDIELVDIQSL